MMISIPFWGGHAVEFVGRAFCGVSGGPCATVLVEAIASDATIAATLIDMAMKRAACDIADFDTLAAAELGVAALEEGADALFGVLG